MTIISKVVTFHTFAGNVEDFNRFFRSYDLQRRFVPPLSNKSRKVRKPKAEMLCRFCGLDATETTFKSKPHMISQLFGSNIGISDFECDRCNNHFSKFESSAADFLGISRTLYALGIGTPPVFKSPDKSIIARPGKLFGKEGIEITSSLPNLIQLLNGTGEIELEFQSNPYIPINVYKTLLKIALTIMPESDFSDYKVPLDFLLSGSNHSLISHYATQVVECQSGFEVRVPIAFLFKKIDPNPLLPSHIFQLYFHDSCLQIHIPFGAKDKALADGEIIQVPLCPPLISIDSFPQGKAKYRKINMSSNEKTAGDIRKIYLNFDKDQLKDSLAPPFDELEQADENDLKGENIKSIFFVRENSW